MNNNKKIDHLDQLIHLPDLQFVKFCEEVFSVNRGVYNTIDAWFYEQDIKNISNRRKLIVSFFCTLYKDKQKIKFGPGGVKIHLEDFWQQHIHLLNKKQDSKVVSSA